MSGKKKDIRSLSFSEIEDFLENAGQKKFRARQVNEWLWKKSCRSFEQMTSLPKETREQLKAHFTFDAVTSLSVQQSSDGTRKSLFGLSDGLRVEGVLIPADGRTTACISSQVGCPLGCVFCSTGQLGFSRHLSFSEMYDQVILLNDQSIESSGKPLSNIVFMGMGEPFLNYDQVQKSIEKITDPDGFAMSPQRITVSTVGIPEKIKKMADDKVKCQLALSLHAATDVKRNEIIPVNKKFPVKEIIDAIKYYHKISGKRITIEYVMLDGFNDGLTDAADLALFCRNFPVKINLIEYNNIHQSRFLPSNRNKIKAFQEFLEKKNIVVNFRKSRGRDIAAACGQLAGQHSTI